MATFPALPDGPAPTTPLDAGSQQREATNKVVRAIHAARQKGAGVGQFVVNRLAVLAALLGNSGVAYVEANSNFTTVTSTGYVITATASAAQIGLVFVAPPSGIIRLYWGADMRCASTAGTFFLATEVRTGNVIGSGSAQSGANDSQAIKANNATNNSTYSRVRYLTGLVPGNVYNVRLVSRSFSGAAVDGSSAWIEADPRLK